MIQVTLPRIGTVAAWRREAHRLARAGNPARDVIWHRGQIDGDLFADIGTATGPAREIRISKTALGEIEAALSHSDPERFARTYAIVLRLSSGDLRWGDRSDPALRRLLLQAKAVRRDIHKMHAFVRFRELPAKDSRRRFGAWFEPEHPCTEAGSPFFARRFGDMDWVIDTPDLTARFVDGTLSFYETDSAQRPPAGATEDLWRAYYGAIFNPARLMVGAMQSEMPKKYWRNLPEAPLIRDMIRTAPARAQQMEEARPTIPDPRRAEAMRRMADRRTAAASPGSFDVLRAEASACTRCPLHRPATQTVFGEGPANAALMIVGEQPGDTEDLTGRPFTGPAGQLFDRVAARAGLDRASAYVTNAVKHFKYRPRGKARIHQRPDGPEIQACQWWLTRERALVRPDLILAMGATAAQALTGDGNRLLARRGTIEATDDGTPVLITVHPSYLLRLPPDQRPQAERTFEDDLITAAGMIRQSAPAPRVVGGPV